MQDMHRQINTLSQNGTYGKTCFYCKFHFVHVSPVVKVAKITRMKQINMRFPCPKQNGLDKQ